jgi:SAM-dependent methyltransferase
MPVEDFEHLPYPSLPQSYTQPAHLAALARLHGLTAPAAETARVLELGCASGGNIIPLAARYPNAQFTGVDLSARHIADGLRRIGLLGLNNIELREGDVAKLPSGVEKFDYIICHGLYSWVPPFVQDAILALTRSCLKPNGFAAISYNVLPGWHLRRVVRDICIQFAGTSGSPRERVARARQALDDIAASASDANPYGVNLRQEAKRVARQPAAYILGEFLSEHNAPCTFTDFCNRAAGAGLSFVCEGDLDASAKQRLADAAPVPRLPPDQNFDAVLEEGQALDFASGRPFRRSLLVHSALAQGQTPKPMAVRLNGLHISAHDKDCHVATLGSAYPGSVTIESALAELSDATARATFAEALLALVMTGQGRLSTCPLHHGRANDAQPKVSALNRLEASDSQPWITSLRHEAVPVSPEQALLIKNLDGSHNRAELAAHVTAAAPNLSNQKPPAAFVEETLHYLERNGTLAPPGSA